jgi:hypothetical protein
MKIQKEFSSPVNVIQNRSAIYYVVKGRKIPSHNNLYRMAKELEYVKTVQEIIDNL